LLRPRCPVDGFWDAAPNLIGRNVVLVEVVLVDTLITQPYVVGQTQLISMQPPKQSRYCSYLLKSSTRERARGVALITADHRNAEFMADPKTGQAHTAHTTFPVRLILFDPSYKGKLRAGATRRRRPDLAGNARNRSAARDDWTRPAYRLTILKQK
jgi:Metalloenzyme superfamily